MRGDLIGMARTLPPDYDVPQNMRPVAGYLMVPRGGDTVSHHGQYQTTMGELRRAGPRGP
jgi:hypothetical protein